MIIRDGANEVEHFIKKNKFKLSQKKTKMDFNEQLHRLGVDRVKSWS